MSTEILRPNAAGDETNLIPKPGEGEANWEDVDEAVSDDDTTRVQFNDYLYSYKKDLYNLPAHSGSGIINKITVKANAMVSESQQPNLLIRCKTHSTVYESDPISTTVGSYGIESKEWSNNPNTGEAWTWDEIDALQIGVGCRSGCPSLWCSSRVTQVWVEIDYSEITQKSSPANWTVGWTPSDQLNAALSSSKNYPPGWSPSDSILAAITSQQNYPPGWSHDHSIEVIYQKLAQDNWSLQLQDASFASNIIWRGLSDKLIAEQKKTSVHPYVSARVYDYQQGIKRLSWSRLYEGEEADNHHGIAFDGQGSMHRIRVDGSTLYRQKVASPDENSTYSSWTQVAADCSGPCAIAAQGARVYIFYRKNDNTIRKYYSPDYGANWTNAELSTYQNAASMTAAWWGTSDIVVCVIANDTAEYGEINAIVLDTSDQSKAEYSDSDAGGHPLTDIYGIAATFDTDRVSVVFSGKSTVGEYTFTALYRTELSDSYEWLDWTYFLEHSAADDIGCRYPDIHLPQDARSYESMQLSLVEKYTGITAYSYPLLSHLVRGAEFSQSMFTEPKHFINISSTYGLRIATSDNHWWLERPDGVWRAVRKPDNPLDLTPDILSIHQAVNSYNKGYLKLILDNSGGRYATPPSRGKEVRLRLGYRTEDGNESRDAGHYWISGWKYDSSKGRSTLTLVCDDAWALADRWIARHTLRWNYDQE